MFVRTQRLSLRPGWIEDAPELARAIGHESVVRNLSGVPWPYARGDAERFLARMSEPDDPFFLICLPHDGQIIGGIGVHAADATGDEFGYWLTPAAWGRGYATEAGRGVIAAARHAMGRKRLQTSHFVDNPASGRVLAKLGFRPTGRTVPRHSIGRGEEVQAVEMVADLAGEAHCPDDGALMAA